MTSLFHNPYDKPRILHPIKNLKWFFMSLKYAFQRVKKGYCDADLIFGVSNWLGAILPDAIDEIRKEKGTIPLICFDEAIRSLGMDTTEYWNAFNNGERKDHEQIEANAAKIFNDALSRISFLLRELNKHTCAESDCEQYEKEVVELLLKWSRYLEI